MVSAMKPVRGPFCRSYRPDAVTNHYPGTYEETIRDQLSINVTTSVKAENQDTYRPCQRRSTAAMDRVALRLPATRSDFTDRRSNQELVAPADTRQCLGSFHPINLLSLAATFAAAI